MCVMLSRGILWRGEVAVNDSVLGDVASLVTDGAGVILEANAAAAAALNLPLDFLVGKPLTVFVYPADFHAFFTRLAEVRAATGPQPWPLRLWPYRREAFDAALHVEARHAPATPPTLRWQWPMPLPRPGGPEPRAANTGEAREVEDADGGASREEALETLRRTYVAAVSHDLLTPLAIIKGHAEVLDDPAVRVDPVLAEVALQAIHDEVERLRRQITNVLDTARLAGGALAIGQEPLRLEPLIEGALRRFRGRSRRHEFVAELPEPLPLVLGDRDRLEGVLYNLLDNAVKYAPRGGEVRVRGVVRAATIELYVEDEGPGIPLAERAHVFQPYYRLGAPPGTRIQGSGLGLHICKAVVEAHGGRIWIEERRGSAGTAVHFTVPRASADLADGLASSE